MITINKEYVEKQIINKSEFICTLIPITDSNDASIKLSEIRKKYYDATHNCYAYIYGYDGENVRFSDDGEPSQTAGVVILDCLKKNNLTNVLAVVTRYFGGIKLGASGLVRAYSSTTALCVKTIVPLHLTTCVYMELNVSYNNFNKISRLLLAYSEQNKSFNNDIYLKYLIPFSEKETLNKKLIELTKGQISITFSEPISLFL